MSAALSFSGAAIAVTPSAIKATAVRMMPNIEAEGRFPATFSASERLSLSPTRSSAATAELTYHSGTAANTKGRITYMSFPAPDGSHSAMIYASQPSAAAGARSLPLFFAAAASQKQKYEPTYIGTDLTLPFSSIVSEIS